MLNDYFLKTFLLVIIILKDKLEKFMLPTNTLIKLLTWLEQASRAAFWSLGKAALVKQHTKNTSFFHFGDKINKPIGIMYLIFLVHPYNGFIYTLTLIKAFFEISYQQLTFLKTATIKISPKTQNIFD